MNSRILNAPAMAPPAIAATAAFLLLLAVIISGGAANSSAAPAAQATVTPTPTPTPTPAPFTFVVNSTGDAPDSTVGNAICETATPGECTLRAALQESAARPGGETVIFNIPGSGVHTITPSSPLPTAFEVSIEATSQPGWAGSPLIELRGTSAGAADGLVVGGTASRPAIVRGLSINGFSGDGIEVF